MNETKTLWQRCEALGQFEDFKDDHVEMTFSDGRWTILNDDHPILYIYEDRMAGSPWLADAILSYIEQIRFGNIKDIRIFCQEDMDRAGIEYVCRPVFTAPTEVGDDEKLAFMNAIDEESQRGQIERLPDVTYIVEAPKQTNEQKTNGERYGMTKDQPAQIDCRETKCKFYAGAGKCINVSPALVLNADSSFWCKSLEPNEESIIESPQQTNEPTPEQCTGLFTWVEKHKNAINYKGFDVSGDIHTRELLVHDKNGIGGGFSITAQSFYGYHDHKDNNVQLTFDQACQMVGYSPTLPYVVESPQQFVSIPIAEWTELQNAIKTMALCFGTKDVEETK